METSVTKRPPAVAGQFYPDDPVELRAEVARFIGDATAARRRIGVVAPHAGYVYSGATAGSPRGLIPTAQGPLNRAARPRACGGRRTL